MRLLALGFGVSLVSFGAAAAGCSSSSSGGVVPTGDSGTPETGGDGGGNTATIHGRLVVINSTPPKTVKTGMTVSAAGQMTTSDPMGNWTLTLPLNQPFSLNFAGMGYASLTEQEATLQGDFDRGDTQQLDNGTAMTLMGLLAGFDMTKGALGVQVIPTGACASEGGGIITANPSGTIVYTTTGNIPVSGQTTIKAGLSISAIVYNLPINTNIDITFSYPADGGAGTCTQSPWPVMDKSDAGATNNLTYTGKVQTTGGNATSFTRIFLQ